MSRTARLEHLRRTGALLQHLTLVRRQEGRLVRGDIVFNYFLNYSLALGNMISFVQSHM